MDIRCPSCGEPWDQWHMRHDEPYDWGLPEELVADFINDQCRFKDGFDEIRQAAEARGWKFLTNSVLSFVQCPSCSESDRGKTDPEVIMARKLLANLLGDDVDGLASELESF